jgi:transposase
MGVQALLDAHVPTHGNWVGLSLGWVSVVWLTHILSAGDHRLNHVAPWAQQRLDTLWECTGQPVHPLDVGDDRLATVLEALSDETHWTAFEGALNQELLWVYNPRPARVRLDRTTASGHWSVATDGLCQFGQSNDHRPDLLQVKVMVSALDPLGMPVATDVVPGQRADDPLYIPAITRVRDGLGRRGLLYVGDCKRSAVEPRAFVQAGGDYYLCPLSEVQMAPAMLAASLVSVWTGEQALTPITRVQTNGQREVVGEGFERWEPRTAVVAGEPIRWMERQLVIRSHQLAQAGERALRAWLAKAQAAVAALHERRRGKRRLTELSALQAEGAAIVARYHVQELLQLWYEAQAHPRHGRCGAMGTGPPPSGSSRLCR